MKKNDLFFYIPSSFAKIRGQTKFQLPEYSRIGSKAMHVKLKEEEEERRKKSVETMASLASAEAAWIKRLC